MLDEGEFAVGPDSIDRERVMTTVGNVERLPVRMAKNLCRGSTLSRSPLGQSRQDLHFLHGTR